ncbi:MAG TPA: Hsp20/alpha crystallin family protein [archaeon]|nr:Hsp20/alpha crystallin family protein [archaeon]
MRRIQGEMNQLFSEMNSFTAASRRREPHIEVKETSKKVIVRMELPGVNKGDITVKATDSTLSIGVHRRVQKSLEKGRFYRYEKSLSRFYKTVSLPADVAPESTQAEYENGLLEVRMNKKSVKPKRIAAKGVEVRVQ